MTECDGEGWITVNGSGTPPNPQVEREVRCPGCLRCKPLARAVELLESFGRPKPRGMCGHCGERPGTVIWGDTMTVNHGMAEVWCKRCVLSAQLAHAKERAAKIPELEAELAAEEEKDCGRTT